MTRENATSTPAPGPAAADREPVPMYEIRVAGRLAPRWSAWFDGLTVAADVDGTTVLRGPVADQAALHGLIQKLRDVGVPLLSLVQVSTDPPTPANPANPANPAKPRNPAKPGTEPPARPTRGERP